MFSERLLKSYKRYKFILWWNRGVLALNGFMAIYNFYLHKYWVVPISLMAVGFMIYALRVFCKSMRKNLIEQARIEMFYIRQSWYDGSGWGVKGMPQLKRVIPILKRLN